MEAPQRKTAGTGTAEGFVLAADEGDAYWWLGSLSINKVGVEAAQGGSASSITGCPQATRRRGTFITGRMRSSSSSKASFRSRAVSSPGRPGRGRWCSFPATCRMASPSRTTDQVAPC
jgi:hypothetical protein